MTQAKKFIREGKVDAEHEFTFSVEEENAILGVDGNNWEEFSKYFIAIDDEFNEKDKAHFKYPYRKGDGCNKKALQEIKNIAGRKDEIEVVSGVEELLEMMETKEDRLDRYHVDELVPDSWMTSPFKKTPEGFLKGRAIVTNTGVFMYVDNVGRQIRELRLPEEVFSRESLDSLKLKPVTNDHPRTPVDTSNVKDFQVGSLGENPSSTTQWSGAVNMVDLTDGYHLAVDMIITDKEAIQDVELGKRALSCGYTCDLEPAIPGARALGMEYDYIQRNIRYNHVAIVDKARAGDAARIRLDSAQSNILISFEEDNVMEMKNITLDGVEYKAEAEVLKNLNQTKETVVELNTKMDALVIEKSKIEAERDTLKDQVEALTKENADAKQNKVDASEVGKLVKARMALVKVAEQMKVEVKDEMSDIEIMKAVIVTKFPNTKLDEKDAVYIQARFDGVVELIATEASTVADAEIRGVKNPVTNETVADSVEMKRKKMIEDQKKAYLNAKKED